MRLRSLIIAAGPWPIAVEPLDIAHRIEATWRGARVFMTVAAARRQWKTEGAPRNAAEQLAADIERAILDAGGTGDHVSRVLIGCMSSHLFI